MGLTTMTGDGQKRRHMRRSSSGTVSSTTASSCARNKGREGARLGLVDSSPRRRPWAVVLVDRDQSLWRRWLWRLRELGHGAAVAL